MTEKFTRPRLGAAKLFTIGGGDEGLGGPLTPIDEKLWTHYIITLGFLPQFIGPIPLHRLPDFPSKSRSWRRSGRN